MASNAASFVPTAENIGLHIDPEHNIYLSSAFPSLEEVKSGSGLEAGEVTVAIKSTGICG